MIEPHNDSFFMKQALNEANEAFKKGEVPIGAVIVCNNQILNTLNLHPIEIILISNFTHLKLL